MKYYLMITLLAILVADRYQYTSATQILGGYQPVKSNAVSDYVLEIAKWSCKQLTEYTKLNGEYMLIQVKDVRTQVVAGINYKMVVDVLVGTPQDKFYVSLFSLLIVVDYYFGI